MYFNCSRRCLIVVVGVLLLIFPMNSYAQTPDLNEPDDIAGKVYMPLISIPASSSSPQQSGDNLFVSRDSRSERLSGAAFWTADKFRSAVPLDNLLDQQGTVVAADLGDIVREEAADSPGFHPGRAPVVESQTRSQLLLPDAGNGRADAVTQPATIPLAADEISGITGYGERPPFTSYYPNRYVENWLSYPWIAIGKLFIETPNGSIVTCSGSVVDSRIVLTAGHCIYFHFSSTGTGWAQNIAFVPAYDFNVAPFGVFYDDILVTNSRWANYADIAFDTGMIILRNNGGDSVGEIVGTLGLTWDQRAIQQFQSFGYPGNIDDGEILYTCSASRYRRDIIPGPDTAGIGCDMLGGSSGGPYIIAYSPYFNASANYVNGLTSYRYVNEQVNYSPYFGGALRDLFRYTQNLAN